MLEKISTPLAGQSKSPLSQAIRVGNLVFTSGQLGRNAGSSSLAGTLDEQTKFSLESLKAILEEAGSSMAHVIKTTVYVKNIKDVPRINQIYQTYFGPVFPARSAIQVAALAGDGLVEIEAIAVVADES
jgi:2-iminobutanoate/2-iminopropanoate deaminase